MIFRKTNNTCADKLSAKKLKRQAGNAAVQTAITLMVGVILLIGAVGAYKYINQAKIGNEIAELTDIKNSTVRYGQSVGLFTSTNATIAVLTGLNFFPAQNVTSSGTASATVSNQWGGTVTPAVGTINTAGDSLVFTYTGITTEACRELVTKLDNVASVIAVGATTTKTAGSPTVASTAIAACAAGDNLSITYTFAR